MGTNAVCGVTNGGKLFSFSKSKPLVSGIIVKNLKSRLMLPLVLLSVAPSQLVARSQERSTQSSQSTQAAPFPSREFIDRLQRISDSSKKRVVSGVVTPGSEVLPAEKVAGWEASLAQLSLLPGIEALEQNNEILIYKIVPDWLKANAQADHTGDHFVAGLEHVLQSLSKEQLAEVNASEKLSAKALTESQRSRLIVLMAKDFPGIPREAVEEGRNRVLEILNSKEAGVSFALIPSLYLFDKGKPLGSISLTSGRPYILKAPQTMPDHAGTYAWTPVPKLIEPRVDLSDADRSIPVVLDRSNAIWKIEEIWEKVQKAGIKTVGVDSRLAQFQCFISSTQWNAYDLLKSVAIVSGCEVRKLGDAYYLAPSAVHMYYAEISGDMLETARSIGQVTDKLQGAFRQKDFTKIAEPFDEIQFRNSAILGFRDLTDLQREAIAPVIPEGVETGTVDVWPVLSVTCGIRGETRGQRSIITLTTFPPFMPLKQPAGNSWKAFPSEFLNSSGAKVTLKGLE